MSHGLSQDEVEDLKEAFNMFDVDGGGEWQGGGDASMGRIFNGHFYILCSPAATSRYVRGKMSRHVLSIN